MAVVARGVDVLLQSTLDVMVRASEFDVDISKGEEIDVDVSDFNIELGSTRMDVDL
jgi:hypothetical protein